MRLGEAERTGEDLVGERCADVTTTERRVTPVPAVGWSPHLQALALWRDPVGSLSGWARRHGDLFSLRLPAVGPVVVVADPGGAQKILRSDPAHAAAGAATGRVLLLLGPDCVLRLDGDAHLERRRVLNPIFHQDSLSRRRSAIVELTPIELASWPVGHRVRTLVRLQDLAFAVIAYVVLGLTDAQAVARLHRLVRQATGPSALAGTWMWPLRRGRLQDAACTRLQRHQAAAADAVAQTVRLAITEGTHHDDALGALLEAAGDETARGDWLYEELRALLVVGHETAAVALAWALERLVREPAVLARLLDSLREGDAAYLDAFIFEVLRWRPPVVDTVRELTEETEVAGRMLGAGTLVMVSPYLVHHHPALYPSPDAFVPDRFVGRAVPDPRGWIPFGGGSRRCLGAELAVMEMQVVLSELLGTFTLDRAESHAERARLVGTVLVPARGAPVMLSSRIAG